MILVEEVTCPLALENHILQKVALLASGAQHHAVCHVVNLANLKGFSRDFTAVGPVHTRGRVVLPVYLLES
jgi:hypothetical protein